MHPGAGDFLMRSFVISLPRMKKFGLALTLALSFLFTKAQTPDAAQLHETARTFMRQGDFANSILVLNRAIQLEPTNSDLIKDLALSHFFSKDYQKALETIKPLVERADADDQSFQIAGNVYKALNQPKEAEKTYKKGLKKFPKSGLLFNEMGELANSQAEAESIKYWEEGIEADPNFPKNYYNAARYYFVTGDLVWGLLYAEIYLNMDPMGSRAPQTKMMLLDGYKKVFTAIDLEKANKDKNSFARAWLQSMNRQTAVASNGINAESLTMIRTRFILDWFNENSRPKFRLFEYQQMLLREGLFDAYNQWIFGSAESLTGFQNWVNIHSLEYNAFTNLQRSMVFKVPSGEYYH
jgi:tetratricopeptide (TPR) repeat protein